MPRGTGGANRGLDAGMQRVRAAQVCAVTWQRALGHAGKRRTEECGALRELCARTRVMAVWRKPNHRGGEARDYNRRRWMLNDQAPLTSCTGMATGGL